MNTGWHQALLNNEGAENHARQYLDGDSEPEHQDLHPGSSLASTSRQVIYLPEYALL